jgi:hypothetical protein
MSSNWQTFFTIIVDDLTFKIIFLNSHEGTKVEYIIRAKCRNLIRFALGACFPVQLT